MNLPKNVSKSTIKMKSHSVFNIFDNAEIPELTSQREEVTCPLCNKRIIIAVPPEFVDWKSIAESYLEMNKSFVKRFAEIMEDLTAMYGENNPVVNYFQNEYLNMMAEIKERFNK